MARLIAAFIIGLGLGAGIVVLVTKPAVEPESTSPAFPVIESPTDATATRPQASQAMPLADIQSLPSEFERRSALYARLQSTDVGTLEILLDEVDDLSNPGRFKHILYSRYLQLDPRAALRRLGEEDRDQQVLIPTTVWAAASLDLDAALAFVDTLDGAVRNRSARNILDLDGLSDAKKEEIAKRFGLEAYLWEFRATSQARTDPAGAWQTALAIEEDGGRRQALHIVAEIWLETDPPAALSALASIEYRETGSWQNSLLRRWAYQDPDAALEWAIAQPGSGQRDPLRLVAGVVAVHSPQEMFELAETLEPARRNVVAEGVLHAWALSDPAAALEALVAMAGTANLGERVGGSIVGAWAETDPRAAFEWVRDREPSAMRTSMLSSTLSGLARSDPLRALSFADELEGVSRSTAIEQVLRFWGREDPRGAASWLDSSEETMPFAASVVARHYADVDPEEAFEWLQDQPVEAQRRAVAAVVRRSAAESPESALRMIDRIRDPSARQTAGSEVLSAWAASDPRAAIRAIPRMDAAMGPDLYQTAFRVWSRSDPDAATAFLDQVPSSNRDSAIQGVLKRTAFRDADLAERLYDRLASEEARRQAAMTLYVSLREVDPKRAERYLELSGLIKRPTTD